MNENDARKCILILGMHRSGTSAVTRTIGYLGARLPKTSWWAAADNPKGFWEPHPIGWINDRLLKELGSSWEDWRALSLSCLGEEAISNWRREIQDVLCAEFGDANLFIVKEPRICRFPDLYLKILNEIRVEPHIVIPFRNPLEVADSLERRNGFSREKNLLLWLRHVLDAERSSRYLPRAFLSYERLLSDWRSAMQSVATSAALTWPNTFADVAADVDDFLEPELRHHKRAAPKADRGVALPWFEEIYTVLLALERSPLDRNAAQIMDKIRHVFDATSAKISDDDASSSEQLVLEHLQHWAAFPTDHAQAAIASSGTPTEAKHALGGPKATPATAKNLSDNAVLAQTSFPIAVHRAPTMSPEGRETSILVGYAPDGRPSPALTGLVKRLAGEGIDCYVCLAVNDVTQMVETSGLESAGAIFARLNGGYDFAAWASLLASYPVLWKSSRLIFVNDSIIPLGSISEVISRLRASAADFTALTESYEIEHHTQSYFFAFQNHALRSLAVRQFWENVCIEANKFEVIQRYEASLFRHVTQMGSLEAEILFSFERLFPAANLSNPIVCNPTHHLWERLLMAGFPFIKAELLHRNPAKVWIGHWEAVVQSLDWNPREAQLHLTEMDRTRIVPKRSNPTLFKKIIRSAATLTLGPQRTDEIHMWNRKRLKNRRERKMKLHNLAH